MIKKKTIHLDLTEEMKIRILKEQARQTLKTGKKITLANIIINLLDKNLEK